MICRIYEFCNDCGITFPLDSKIKNECKYCKHEKICTICVDCDIHITNKKMSWVIIHKIDLQKIQEFEKYKFITGIKIDHPFKPCFWLIKTQDNYVFKCVGKTEKFNTLDELNAYLNRDVCETDNSININDTMFI